MAALHRTGCIGRHCAEHGQTGVFLDNARIVIGHARRNAVQNHAADGVLFKLQKAAQQCRQRQRHALGGDDEHGRGLREPRNVRRRIFAARAGKPVIVAHDAFDHGNIAPRAALQQGGNRVPPAQKRIQIARARADNPAVEHRVDVIRSAFECRRIQSLFHKCLQQRTGDCRLAAAASRAADDQPRRTRAHRLPPIRYTGFCAVIM